MVKQVKKWRRAGGDKEEKAEGKEEAGKGTRHQK